MLQIVETLAPVLLRAGVNLIGEAAVIRLLAAIQVWWRRRAYPELLQRLAAEYDVLQAESDQLAADRRPATSSDTSGGAGTASHPPG